MGCRGCPQIPTEGLSILKVCCGEDFTDTFATVYSTTFLSVMSLLLPTSSLLTPSVAYRSISCSHCFTLLKESMSVTS